jgi:hypothetical protein
MVTDRIVEHRDRNAYLHYRQEAEKLNLEREKTGLAPQPIMTIEEWKKLKQR